MVCSIAPIDSSSRSGASDGWLGGGPCLEGAMSLRLVSTRLSICAWRDARCSRAVPVIARQKPYQTPVERRASRPRGDAALRAAGSRERKHHGPRPWGQRPARARRLDAPALGAAPTSRYQAGQMQHKQRCRCGGGASKWVSLMSLTNFCSHN